MFRPMCTSFHLLFNDEIDEALTDIYTKNNDYSDIHLGFLTDFPGLNVLRAWAHSGFKEKVLDKAKLSEGMKMLIKLPLIEQGIFINGSNHSSLT
jgi:hypothetical protein